MKVSIIVPVYKSEPFLEDCINSIINQIFTDWELILVDDGSPDFCGRICDSFAVKDSRIKVLHQKNSGVSVARNRGIYQAKGEYICFVDSDDLIEPDFLNSFWIGEENADLYLQGYKIVNEDKEVQNIISFSGMDQLSVREWKSVYIFAKRSYEKSVIYWK